MKLPSVEQILRGAGVTARRFPLALLCAFTATIAGLILADHEMPLNSSVLFPVLLASAVGLLLATSFVLMAERWSWKPAWFWGSQVLILVITIGYALTVPTDLLRAPAIHGIQFSVLVAGLSLFLMIGPFLKAGHTNGFWHYNKALYFRLFVTGIYAAVLYAGLAIALVALDQLFGVYVVPKRYFELWILIAGLFAPWFFLAGVPENLDSLEQSHEYPKGLRIFAQYILLTLVVVYLVILYAYLTKILVQWNWPKGWVSSLILGFSATAIVTQLLLFPVRELPENRWIRIAGRWLYIILIPLIVVLFLALSERISDYGITESRYAGFALGFWLAVQALYFLFSKTRSIKFTVGSLCVLAFVMSFGPWGMFSVSESSQVTRLQALLERDGILVSGKVQKSQGEISTKDRQQISSIVAYLHEIHGYDRIAPWFSSDLVASTTGERPNRMQPEDVVQQMGLAYSLPNRWFGGGVTLQRDETRPIRLEGYDKMVQGQPGREKGQEPRRDEEWLHSRISNNSDTLVITLDANGQAIDSARVDLSDWKRQLLGKYTDSVGSEWRRIPPEEMAVACTATQFTAQAYLNNISVTRDNRDTTVGGYNMIVLYSTNQGETSR